MSVNSRLAAIETIVGSELPVIRQILQGAAGGAAGSEIAGEGWPATPADGQVWINTGSRLMGYWNAARARWYDLQRRNAVVFQGSFNSQGQPQVSVSEGSVIVGYLWKPSVHSMLEGLQVSILLPSAPTATQITFSFAVNQGGDVDYPASVQNIVIPVPAVNTWVSYAIAPNVPWNDIPILVTASSIGNEFGDDPVRYLLSGQYRQAVA